MRGLQYAVKDRTEGVARNGQPFLRLTLGRADGDVKAVYWNVPPEALAVAVVGTVIEVDGRMDEYRGEEQLVIQSLWPVPPEQIRYEELLPVSPHPSERQWQRVRDLIENVIESEQLREFLSGIILRQFEMQYRRWPAATHYHHAWIGGLMDHSLEVADIAGGYASTWNLNMDLVIAGALLHDIGKVREYQVGATFTRTTAGQFLGHVVQGMQIIQERQESDYILHGETYQHLLHIVASHHGTREWGAVTEPRTPEAVAVHLADLASARLSAITRHVGGHTGPDEWTKREPMTGLSFFVPGAAQPVAAETAAADEDDQGVPF